MRNPLRICALLLLSLPALASTQQNDEQVEIVPTQYEPPPARICVDVVVTDKAGKPIRGLGASDFTLLDNGQPEKVLSFQAVDGSRSNPDPPVEVILVIDAVNQDGQQVSRTESEIEGFLRQNNGLLTQPISIYRLTGLGLSASTLPSLDGNALAKEVARGKEPRLVSKVPIRGIQAQLTSEYAGMRNNFSLQALGVIAIEQRRKPGRKLVLWMGPGWPIGNGANNSFDWVTEFATRMREARISLYSFSELPPSDGSPTDGDSARGVKSAKYMQPGDLALDVLAPQSGGRVMVSAFGLAGSIRKSVEDASFYYTLWFDPPRTNTVDEIHELKVVVNQPKLNARTRTLYYDEPAFYDQPKVVTESLTLDQLEQRLTGAEESKDGEFAQRLSAIELTERMNSLILASRKSRMPGEKSRAALVALADASVFLDPPVEKTGADPKPDVPTQRLMLSRTINYLRKTIPRLPDFFAQRTMDIYAEPSRKDDQTWKTATDIRTLHRADTIIATMLYRNGREQVDAEKAKVKLTKEEGSLITKGTFGPILSTVVLDAARSAMSWSRWDRGLEGPRAVFRFVVPREKSHYALAFCCLTDMSKNENFEQATGYHGELTIDPVTGDILRLAVQADLKPGMPLLRADIMVEYAPVSIGGKTYIGPERSVSITRRRTASALHEWGQTLRVFGPYVTMLSDSTFDDYHKFGSESRILPDFAPVSDKQ
jgi:VWFA-related protein